MALENPTFSESWYRVAELRPRLRATVQIHRQHFRGQLWHVVRDPANNEFFRLHEAAYRFVAMLDGRRTVAEVWRACNAALGDDALTQNEVIQVLGRLYAGNLLLAELPPDTEGLFQRYRKRKVRELRQRLTNVLFLRVALLDPDRLLDALVGVAGLAFTPVGFVLWLAVVGVGAYFALSDPGELFSQGEALLNAEQIARNLPMLYGAFLLAKLVHELAHGLACKKFGRRTPSGGEVHAMGIMLLVFAPMPYVDASSAWALRSKLHRTIVGAAGMMAELALASVAAVVWAWTAGVAEPWAQGLHAASYHLLFVASAATLLFNANPLLRFDGYYILSDLLEIPNLSNRSRQYVQYLVRRHVWGVRHALNPAQTPGEAAWLAVYGVSATLFRIWICVRILLLLTDRFFVIGSALAVLAVITWVLLPLARFVRYLATAAELQRVRLRAIGTTLAVLAAAIGGLGWGQAPDRPHVEGVVAVDPNHLAVVYAETDGFAREVLPSGRAVRGEPAEANAATPLLRADNRDLEVKLRGLGHEREVLEARLRAARLQSSRDARYVSLVQILTKDLEDLDEQAATVRDELASLTVRAPRNGTWISRGAERLADTYVRQGDRLGAVADLDELIVRVRPTQRLAGMLLREAARDVEIRLSGRPETILRGTVRQTLPAAQRRRLARGGAGGAPGAGASADEAGERFFEMHVVPDGAREPALLPGQRVVVRFRMPERPLLGQWWRSLRQLAQRRLGV